MDAIDTNFLQYYCCAILRMHNRAVRGYVNVNKHIQSCSLSLWQYSITGIAGLGCVNSNRFFNAFSSGTEFPLIKFTVLLSSAEQNSTVSNER